MVCLGKVTTRLLLPFHLEAHNSLGGIGDWKKVKAYSFLLFAFMVIVSVSVVR
jgi:hypothetical protein